MLNCLEFSCIHTVRTSSPEICVAILDDTIHFVFTVIFMKMKPDILEIFRKKIENFRKHN